MPRDMGLVPPGHGVGAWGQGFENLDYTANWATSYTFLHHHWEFCRLDLERNMHSYWPVVDLVTALACGRFDHRAKFCQSETESNVVVGKHCIICCFEEHTKVSGGFFLMGGMQLDVSCWYTLDWTIFQVLNDIWGCALAHCLKERRGYSFGCELPAAGRMLVLLKLGNMKKDW